LSGSAAIPVIMTLPTNVSAAALGSSIRCLTNQTDQPSDYFTMTTTRWANDSLRCIRVALPNGSDPQVIGDYGGGKYYDRSGRAWYPSGDRFVPNGYTTGPGYVVQGYTNAYTYIYVGQDGTYWGVDPAYRSRGGLAVYGSCYVSIMGATATG
jgi:hypothetical protein